MSSANVSRSFHDGICRITLTSPEKGNALSAQAVLDLDSAFDAAQRDGARLIVFEGNGRHFCTGFDLSGIEHESDGDLLLRFVTIEGFLRKVFDSPVPTAAFARGAAFGAGADLFVTCDYRVALDGARFAFPGAGFGLVLGTGRLANRIGRDASRSLLLRGETWDTPQALSHGLATATTDENGMDALLTSLAQEASRLDPGTVAALRAATPAGHADSELAQLCRSAAWPGLKNRIIAYRAKVQNAKAAS